MKSHVLKCLLFFGLLYPFQFFGQNGSFDYQLNEQQVAEKRMAFSHNPNTLNYDVTYQKLELEVDPAVHYINGTVTTQFVANEDLQTIVFDLSHQLLVTDVVFKNQSLPFSQMNNELNIQLNQLIEEGDSGEISVVYNGIPPTDEGAFVQTFHDDAPIIWTLSEPFGAKDWWPCKQSLNDKMDSIDVFLKTPADMVAVSNGIEQSQTKHIDGTKTTHFKHRYPIPAYLVAIAVSNYQLYEQSAGTAPNTFPIVNYLYPETYQYSVSQLQITLPIMDLFEDLFGVYPFHEEKYGHAQFSWGGGMEHTTVSFMGNFSQHLIAHELAHHWFGNKVTCGSWKDIWINEGFAEYMAGLVIEHLEGFGPFVGWKSSKITRITSEPDGNLYLKEHQVTDAARIFNGRITYDKGCMVVHMLRYVLGDEVFYQAMRDFLSHPDVAYDYVETEQLREHLQASTSVDLTEFFNDWIYGEGYPSYHADVEILSPLQIKINLSQTTSHPSVSFFEMPVTLHLKGTDNNFEQLVLHHSENNQEFIIDTGLLVKEVVIDPFYDIIGKNHTVSLHYGDAFKEHEVVLFPNPVTDSFQIVVPGETEILAMNLYDINGKLIDKNIASPYDARNLSTGVYTLMINTTERVYHKRILKN